MSTDTAPDRILMFGAEWCRDCRRSKALLDREGVAYDYVDLEAVADGADRAYAISGRPEWDALAPVLSVTLRGGVSVDLRLDPAPPDAGTCAIASLHRVGGTLVLRREAEYLPGQQQQVAEAYGWDLPWASGRTLPPVRVR